MMKKRLLLAISIILAMFAAGCADKEGEMRRAALEAERDSLESLAGERDRQLNEMTVYFDSVASCLDSIAIHEHLLLPLVDPETARPYSRTEIRERLKLLAGHITRQRERIRQLTDSLNSPGNTPGGAGISNTVLFLTQQLEEKEARVAKLMAELNDKNRNIRELTRKVSSLSDELQSSQEQNSALATAVVAQSEMMNESYVLIGDKKQLQQAGALTKGSLLKKGSFNPAGINLSKCQKVDIREFREIPLGTNSARILSAAPAGSYHWSKGPGGKILVIDSPTAFWSLSNILVIQL